MAEELMKRMPSEAGEAAGSGETDRAFQLFLEMICSASMVCTAYAP